MKKAKIRKALKSLGIVSLIASIGFLASGCKTASGSCGSKGTATEKTRTSCGRGSCGR